MLCDTVLCDTMVRKGRKACAVNKCENKKKIDDIKRKTRSQTKIEILKSQSSPKKGKKLTSLKGKKHFDTDSRITRSKKIEFSSGKRNNVDFAGKRL